MLNQPRFVFILGAGCSVEDGAPLMNDFFDVAFSTVYSKLSLTEKQKFDNVKAFRDKNLPGANVEELLSYIDLEKYIEVRVTAKEIRPIRQDVISLISKTMQTCLRGVSSNNYANFFTNMISSSEASIDVITFNWDILLDTAFFTQGSLLFYTDGTASSIYGAEFADLNAPSTQPALLQLLKLHGSLNWGFCSKCKKYYYKADTKIMEDLLETYKYKCKCGQRLKPSIIPPTFHKIGNNDVNFSIFKHIWKTAFRKIASADYLVVIGYSFPEDDIHFKLFLRNALVNNYEINKRPVKIIVVNYKKYLDQKIEFERHYNNMLGSSHPYEIEFIYESFGSFVKKYGLEDLMLDLPQ